MNYFLMKDGWITIYMNKNTYSTINDTILLELFKSVIFKQMLEPPIRNEVYMIVEGRMILGAEKRLKTLGIFET